MSTLDRRRMQTELEAITRGVSELRANWPILHDAIIYTRTSDGEVVQVQTGGHGDPTGELAARNTSEWPDADRARRIGDLVVEARKRLDTATDLMSKCLAGRRGGGPETLPEETPLRERAVSPGEMRRLEQAQHRRQARGEH